MSESNDTLAKLQFEIQTVHTEVKTRQDAFLKMETETEAQLRELELKTRNHTALVNCQTEGYNKYTGLIKETIEDLNSILRNMISAANGEAPDLTADLIEKLELKLLDKARTENDRMLQISDENIRISDQVPGIAEKMIEKLNTERRNALKFQQQAEKRIKELEESINRIRKDSHER